MLRLIALSAACGLMASAALAQDAVDDLFAQPVERAQGEPAPKADKAPSPPTPVLIVEPDPEIAVTQTLNAEVEARNRAVREANREAEIAYEAERREHAAWVQRLEQEHQAEQAAYEAELVRQQQAHEASLAEWRRRVEACQSGVIAACDPSTVR